MGLKLKGIVHCIDVDQRAIARSRCVSAAWKFVRVGVAAVPLDSLAEA
jgi:hypothetical protein